MEDPNDSHNRKLLFWNNLSLFAALVFLILTNVSHGYPSTGNGNLTVG